MALPFAVRAPLARGARGPELRLFLALWPDEATRARIDTQARAAGLAGRAVPAANLHMTLVFVGAVPARRVALLEAVVDAVRAPAFDLTLDHLGRFSGARVGWAGCRATPAPLSRLQSSLEADVRQAGFAVETRAFRPHVTLVRDSNAPVASVDWAPVAWRVREVALVRSDPGPVGPVYRPLRRRLLSD